MCYGYIELFVQIYMGKKLMFIFNLNFRFKDLKLIIIIYFKYIVEEINFEVMWMFCLYFFML